MDGALVERDVLQRTSATEGAQEHFNATGEWEDNRYHWKFWCVDVQESILFTAVCVYEKLNYTNCIFPLV